MRFMGIINSDERPSMLAVESHIPSSSINTLDAKLGSKCKSKVESQCFLCTPFSNAPIRRVMQAPHAPRMCVSWRTRTSNELCNACSARWLPYLELLLWTLATEIAILDYLWASWYTRKRWRLWLWYNRHAESLQRFTCKYTRQCIHHMHTFRKPLNASFDDS